MVDPIEKCGWWQFWRGPRDGNYGNVLLGEGNEEINFGMVGEYISWKYGMPCGGEVRV